MTEKNILGIHLRESCETCIHSHYLCEYTPDGDLIPESRYYLCKINDEEYYAPDTPTDCRGYQIHNRILQMEKIIKER